MSLRIRRWQGNIAVGAVLIGDFPIGEVKINPAGEVAQGMVFADTLIEVEVRVKQLALNWTFTSHHAESPVALWTSAFYHLLGYAAWDLGNRPSRFDPLVPSPITQMAMTNKWLTAQGLVSIKDQWVRFHYPVSTA